MGERGQEVDSERRTFLSRLLTGSLAIGFLSALGAILAYLFPPERREFNPGRMRLKVGRADEFAVGEGKQVLFHGRPVWVIRLKGGFVALSAVCTHQGCIVTWDEKRALLRCPCHGGLFDTDGNVVAGLPRRPLPHLRVEVLGGEVFISEG
jgi:cytochrome b6-f complex iron-sulfur subunit